MVIYVGTGWTFSLCDCNRGDNGIEANGSFFGNAVEVSGVFNMYGGAIRGSSKKGGVEVASNNGSTFNMYGGEISGNKWGVDVRGSVSFNGTFNMYDGVISGNKGGEYGGGVVVEKNATFNMSGGKITKNSAQNGGGVHVGESAKFNMTGGEITGNTATNGGGVYVGEKATFNMTGGEISGNTATKGGGVYVDGTYGDLIVTGAPKIIGNKVNETENNVYLPSSNKTITIGEGGLSSGAKIGVTVLAPPTKDYPKSRFATAGTDVTLTRADAKAFFVDNNTNKTYSVQLLDDNKLYVYYGNLHRHPICVDASCTDSSHEHTDVDWTGVSELTNDMTAGYYYLTADVKLSKTWEPAANIVLCLNGYSITQTTASEAVKIPADGKLTLTDCKDGGKVTHADNVNGTGVYVANKATFTMYGGSITGNTNTNRNSHGGGGVYVANGGEFTLNGGSISGNTNDCNYSAGGVYVAGTFNMGGGDITGNKNTNGTNSGGGVLVEDGTFKMSNGKITKNTSKYDGGGIYIYSGTFTMDGGSISENESTERGGGVYVNYKSTFAMSNGKITGNTAGGFEGGGGVCVGMNGVFTMDGGKITGNNTTSDICAGGVYVSSDSTFTVSGEAQITGNWMKGIANNEGIYGPYINSAVGNVYLVGSSANVETITIGEGLMQSAEIGVSISTASLPTAGNNVKIATGATNNELNYAGIFKLDMDDQSYSVIRNSENNLVICPHQHSWGYEVSEADSATIKAICKAKDCPNTDGGSITIKASDERTYDGNAKTATLAGSLPGVTAPTITYKAKGSDTSIEAPVNVGTYIASITIMDADNKSVTASVEYIIEAKELTNLTIEVEDAGIYDGSKKEPKVTVKDGDNLIPVGYYDVTYSNNTNAGEATVTVKSKDGNNYSFNSSKTFTIGKATITVTPDAGQCKTYGDKDPELTYTSSGAVNDETPAFTGALSRAKGENVRDKNNICKYAINIGDLKLVDGEGFIASNYELKLSSTEVNFTINYRSVTVTGVKAKNKTYDGTTDVTFDYTNAKLENVLEGDDLTVTVSGIFTDKNVGENKTILLVGTMFQGDSASNYVLGGYPVFTADITPKELTIKDVTVADKTYDGTTTADVTGVTFNGFVDGESLTANDYTVSGKFADAAVGTGKSVTVTVDLKDSVKNYTLPKNRCTKTDCVISKATAPISEVAELIVTNNVAKTYTFPLSSSLPTLAGQMEYGNVTYSIVEDSLKSDYYTKNNQAEIKDGQLNLPILAAQRTGKTDVGTITVNVTSSNVEDFTLTIKVTATDKIVPKLEGTLKLSSEEITYGGKLDTITISGTMKDGNNEVPGKFTWKDGSIKPAVGDGTYAATWKFTPDDEETYEEATGTVTVKVKKAAQSGTVSMGGYTYNAAPGEPELKDRTGDDNAEVTYYYSTTDTDKGGTKWENIGKTTLNAGTYYMYAVIGATANYNAFTTPAVEFVVEQAKPNFTKPTGVTAKYGQKLSEITLTNPADGEWSWQAPDNVFDTIGVSKQYATFKPTSPNYKEVSNIAIEVTVGKADGGNLGTVELEQAFNDSDDHTYTPDWSKLPAGQTWSYGYESSDSNNFTKLEASAENVTYAVSGGKAGDKLTVTLKASCENYDDFTITLNITITKATPTGEPAYTKITTGDKTLADAALTLTGSTLKPAEGTVEWIDADGNVLSDKTKVEVNTTYTWRFTPTDSDNYKVLTGGIELYHVDMPVISAQPKDASVKAGERAVFEVTATGTDLTYQWQIDRNDGNGFVNLKDATGASYTSGVTDRDCNGFKYQCIISNAAGSVTTDTVTLTVTEETPPAPKYEITEGADSAWTQNVDGSLVIKGNGDLVDFLKVLVDGTEIDPVNYTAAQGSTIITLKPEFLSTLSEGSHTFEIVWTNGSADTHFTVARNSSGNNNNNNNNSNNNSSSDNAGSDNTADKTVIAPKTGDASKDALLAVLVVVSFAGLAGMLVLKKRNAYK